MRFQAATDPAVFVSALSVAVVAVVGAITAGAVKVIGALRENTRASNRATTASNTAATASDAAAISSKVAADASTTSNGRTVAQVVESIDRKLDAHIGNASIHRTEG